MRKEEMGKEENRNFSCKMDLIYRNPKLPVLTSGAYQVCVRVCVRARAMVIIIQ